MAHRTLAAALAATTLISLASSGAAALSHPDQGHVDSHWAREPREMSYQIWHTGFFVEVGDLANRTDVQTYTFDTASATLIWSLQPGRGPAPSDAPSGDSSSTERTQAPPIEARLRFNSIYEYDDIDRDNRLGLADSVVRNVPFASMVYPWVTSRETTEHEREIAVRYTLPDVHRGQLHLRFLFTTVPQDTANETRWPTHVSASVSIERFGYVRANETMLALDARVSPDPALVEGAVRPRGTAPYTPQVAWNDTALHDHQSHPVGFTMERYSGAQDDEAMLAFSYARGAIVTHDLSIGHVRIQPPSTLAQLSGQLLGEWRLFVTGVVIAAAIVGGAAYPRIRSRM